MLVNDVLEEIDTETLLDEIKERLQSLSIAKILDYENFRLLETIYLEQRAAGKASNAMQEYIYKNLGRIL
jgi:hypothetical protein